MSKYSTIKGSDQARDFVREADKKLKGFMGFGKNYDDAQDLYIRAANAFKLGKQWQDAGDTYQKLAAVDRKLDSAHDAATHYLDAAKCYQKIKSPASQECFKKAIQMFTTMGRLSQAARALKELGEQSEKERDIESALQFYANASEMYIAEDQKSEFNKCRLKMASLMTTNKQEQYKDACEIFEEVGTMATENNLLKFGAKDHFMNAALCRLAVQSPDEVRRSLDKYSDIDVSFGSSRQYKLLDNIITAMISGNLQEFTDAVADYDSMTKLDSWRTSILLKVKNRLSQSDFGAPDDVEDFT